VVQLSKTLAHLGVLDKWTREAGAMGTHVSICTPGARVVAVFVGQHSDGKWYADIAPAVAVYCRHDSADTGGSFHTLLFHREGCDTGRESELRMSEDEVAGTFNAPWPYVNDRSELAGAIEALKRQ